MRYDTFTAVSQFVQDVQDAGLIRRFYEDGDMMYFSLKTGERVMGYMVERSFTLQNLRHHLSTNGKRGRYSMFFFYSDLFMPDDGDIYAMDDWMEALVAVQGGRIYGYWVTGKQAYFYPVYFNGTGRYRHVVHGDLIHLNRIHGVTVETDHPLIAGRWRVTSFEPMAGAAHENVVEPLPLSPVAHYYAVLGISLGEPLAGIKKAYRDLARQYHPDLNTAPDAIIRMKQINEAYQRVIQTLLHD